MAYYAAINFPYLGKDVADPEVERYAYERILHVNNVLGSNWSLAGKTVVEHYKERRWIPHTYSAVLTEEEKQTGSSMCLCVSRAKADKIVVDL